MSDPQDTEAEAMMPFSYPVSILEAAGHVPGGLTRLAEREQRVITMSTPSEAWSEPDVHRFMNRMCALIKPPGSLFVYQVSPDSHGLWVIWTNAFRWVVVSQPMPLQTAVVDALGKASREKIGISDRPYGEKESRGGFSYSMAESVSD